MNLTEFINSVAERTGYASDTLKEALNNPALAQINLPDDFKTAYNTNLLSIKEAKINPDIKKHFAGVHLGGVDAVINDLLDEHGFADDQKNLIKGEASTYDKIKIFTKTLSALKDEAAKAVGGDKAKLVDEINKLNLAVSTLKDQHKNEVSSVQAQWLGKFSDHLIGSHFEKYDFAMDTIPKDVQAKTARMVFEQKLTEKGGKIKYEDGNIRLVSATDEALPFTIENKPVEFNAFADMVVAENKMIKVKGQQPPAPPAPTPRSGGEPVFAPAAKNTVSKALEELRAGSQA